jgi:thiosulfate/3-mercaptopyruvate sulfurtransferase
MARAEIAVTTLTVASGYAYPEVLCSTSWVADHLNDPAIRLIEADEDTLLYELGHIRGAVKLDWHSDAQEQLKRDVIDQKGFEHLMSRLGIANDTTVVFYGDKNNWYACYAFWLFARYGHQKMKIMNGGRLKWETEEREMAREVPRFESTTYYAQPADDTLRAYHDDVLGELKNPSRRLIDVRSPQEYSGELINMPDYPQEGAQRGGHIPTAKNIPWHKATEPDGTFKSAEELRQLYGSKDITPDKEVIAYCRIGERSAHTWFVLSRLLGFPRVRNYDGSWTEWGSMVRVPIEK